MKKNKIKKAELFAKKAHSKKYTRKDGGEFRKYTGDDYYKHPLSVANIVRTVPHTEAMICAAILHDVVEDTFFTLDDIVKEFGKDVAELVEMLTDISNPSYGNRKERKAKDREHIAKASNEAKTIKLADIIENTSSIKKYSFNKFWPVYKEEVQLLLEILKDGGDSTLYDIANKLISI